MTNNRVTQQWLTLPLQMSSQRLLKKSVVWSGILTINHQLINQQSENILSVKKILPLKKNWTDFKSMKTIWKL